jgi:hypothetical protein
MSNLWRQINPINPQTFLASRVQLHYAIQFIPIVGLALAIPKEDYSHIAMEFNSESNIFVGKLIEGEKPFRVALEPVNLIAQIVDAQNHPIAEFFLDGKTMVEAFDWHKQEIAKLGADTTQIQSFEIPPDDFPDADFARGAAFDTSQDAEIRQEVTNYFANTQILLQEIALANPDSTPIDIWTHHFDMAIKILLPGEKNGEPMSIGIGMSPGDFSYNEPYWYVIPWPYLPKENLPALEEGSFWHNQDWIGAVLLSSQLAKDPDGQQKQLRKFLDLAITAGKTFLALYSASE